MLWISDIIYDKLLLTPEKGGICPISAQSPAPIKLAAPAEWADPPRRGRSWDHIPMASVRVSTASDTDLAARWAARMISRPAVEVMRKRSATTSIFFSDR